jgi:hypothetical protein
MKLLARFLVTSEETHLVNRDIEGDVRDALVKNSSPTATIIHNFSLITTLIAEILQDDARTQSCKMMTMKKKEQTDRLQPYPSLFRSHLKKI